MKKSAILVSITALIFLLNSNPTFADHPNLTPTPTPDLIADTNTFQSMVRPTPIYIATGQNPTPTPDCTIQYGYDMYAEDYNGYTIGGTAYVLPGYTYSFQLLGPISPNYHPCDDGNYSWSAGGALITWSEKDQAEIYFGTPGTYTISCSHSGYENCEGSCGTSFGGGSASITVKVIGIAVFSPACQCKNADPSVNTVYFSNNDFNIQTNPSGFESLVSINPTSVLMTSRQTYLETFTASLSPTTISDDATTTVTAVNPNLNTESSINWGSFIALKDHLADSYEDICSKKPTTNIQVTHNPSVSWSLDKKYCCGDGSVKTNNTSYAGIDLGWNFNTDTEPIYSWPAMPFLYWRLQGQVGFSADVGLTSSKNLCTGVTDKQLGITGNFGVGVTGSVGAGNPYFASIEGSASANFLLSLSTSTADISKIRVGSGVFTLSGNINVTYMGQPFVVIADWDFVDASISQCDIDVF